MKVQGQPDRGIQTEKHTDRLREKERQKDEEVYRQTDRQIGRKAMAGLVLVCSDERKCAVMKGYLWSDKLRRNK